MKILIDIGHPAHVHYFKNFIQIMKEEGHEIIVTACDKEIAFQLLDYYKIPFSSRGKGRRGVVGKFFNIFLADYKILKVALRHRPDFFLSFGSPYASHVAFLMRKPHIAFDDTDYNPFEQALYVPFTKHIFTPTVYKKDYGNKHIRFDGFMELGSLHPNRFRPYQGDLIARTINLKTEKFILFRFVSWQASHDIGLTGLSIQEKIAMVEQLSQYAKVVISSESPLPEQLQQYAYTVHPALMHDVLKNAALLITESLTMAAEAAFLQTPTLCISTAQAGTLDEEVRLGLIELFREKTGLQERAIEILEDPLYKSKFSQKSEAVVRNLVDLTALLLWIFKNYPNSISQARQSKHYQDQFKSATKPQP